MNNATLASMRIVLAAMAALAPTVSASAKIQPFPPSFHVENIKTDGATIHVRVGGKGPAVVMLHGFGDTGDMWAPLAAALVKDHTVVVPDLRGVGLSSYPETGYDKKTQAQDIARVMDKLNIQKASCHARHWQHGRLRARRAVPRSHYTLGCYRCAATGHRPVGRNS
jgi:predicted alpha/beta-fold hydrolase